jgi:ketosteroid isomerase-like protein
MTPENLELVRRGHAAFTRGDLSPIRRIVAVDVDWGTTGSFPGLEASYRGSDALDAWMDAVRAAWEWFEVTVDDVLRDDGDVLVIRERLRGRGRESGAEVDMRITAVYWFEAGRIARRRVFDTEAEAVEAAGRGH